MAGNVTRNRAGQIVKDTSLDLVSPLRALLDAGAGTVRGMTVGTLGAPAELLNLLRVKSMGGSDIPYNMEYWNKVLPSAGGSHDTAVGQALGEFVPLPNRVVMAPVKAVKAIPGAIRHGASEFARAGVPAHVIKPKGGNWLAGSVEEAIEPLKRNINAVPLSELERGWAEAGLTDSVGAANIRAQRVPEEALNKWLESKLGKYIRNEMGTPEDPLRELAGRGITHVPNKEDLMLSGDWIPEETVRNRKFAGYPEEPTSTLVHAERGYPADEEEFARMAAGWENAADSAISPFYARTVKGTSHEPGNPWINKVDPETMVYQADRDLGRYGELGFPHLVDELKNAMDPASGLPRHLQLDPSKLEKITVPQASELVSKINAWRAEQKIAANAEKANNAATVVHKEYPEQGYKWVELKAPTEFPDEEIAGQLGETYRNLSPEGQLAVREDFLKQRATAALDEALKYEGSTMGHCVGGYCPDVIEGRSRIFSLRDKKGEPHVTIEVKPQNEKGYYNSLPPEERAALLNRAIEYKKSIDPSWDELADPKERAVMLKQYLDAQGVTPPSSIVQIKGKANKKPKEEYLPFVQDFVRSGKWSDVGDAANAGLRKFNSVFNSSELKALQDAGVELPAHGYLTGKQVQELHNMITPENKRFVYDDFGNIIDDPYSRAAREQNNFAGGGLVGLESKYGLAPYGLRHAGDSVKGLGYFGAIPGREGHMTEVSAEDDLGEYPLLVPGLTADEIRHLAEGNEPTEEIYRKAGRHADKRRAAGRSTFIERGELRHPKPEEFASGGLVEYNPAEIENAVARLREDMYA